MGWDMVEKRKTKHCAYDYTLKVSRHCQEGLVSLVFELVKYI